MKMKRFNKKGSKFKSVSFVKKPTYYMKSLEYNLKINFKDSYGKQFKEHILHTMAAFKFISSFRRPSDEIVATIRVQCARLSDFERNSTE